MSKNIQLKDLGRDDIEFCWGELPLFRYVASPQVPASECPKPYFHPIRNLQGDVITNFRPNDHPWHQGLSMTMTRVNETNFWGGVTYRKEDGYQMRNNVGSQNHIAWLERSQDTTQARLKESLIWRNESGVDYFSEIRGIEATVFPDIQCWHLKLSFEFENISGKTLRLGTYESEEGLTGSHYTGLFLRLSRDYFGCGENEPLGTYLADEQRGVAAIHGTPADWMACVGRHDNSDSVTTLICCDHAENPHYPTRWFYRPGMPSLAMPFVGSSAISLSAGERLRLRYDLIVADGALMADEVRLRIQACGIA